MFGDQLKMKIKDYYKILYFHEKKVNLSKLTVKKSNWST